MRTKTRSKWKMSAMMTAVAVGLLGTATAAFADTIPGYAGKTLPNAASNAGCMSESWGAIVNGCGGQVNYEIPVPVTGGASYTVSVAVNNPGGGAFECVLFTVNSTGQEYNQNPQQCYPNTGNQVCTFNSGTYVPTGGAAYVWCNVNANGKIYNVTYN